MKPVQGPAWRVHFIDRHHGVEYAKLDRQFLGMMRLNARLRLREEELLNALVPEALDHAIIVYRNATLYAFNCRGESIESTTPSRQTTLARVMIEAESEPLMRRHADTIANAIRTELGA